MQQPVEKSPAAPVRRRLRRAVALAVVAAVAVLPAYHFLWRQHVKRFQVLRPGVFYRVAQPSELGIQYLIERHGMKTILNLRLEDERLRRGILGLNAPDGPCESEFVEDRGARNLQWPMGLETYWPWVTPWHFEEFFHLIDDPENLPVAVHCVSGRHRTGTMAALFRLEYDHWPIERVLNEMYSFSFGAAVPLQEMNLRTYVPRPQPTAAEWKALQAAWPEVGKYDPPADFSALAQRLRKLPDQAALKQRLCGQLQADATFALPLAVRLIDGADDPAAVAAVDAAIRSLANAQATFADHFSAAALVADFGNIEQQKTLIDLLHLELRAPQPNQRFRAVAAGIAGRYTTNRIPFLTVLLDDERIVADTGNVRIRYCDLAVVRLAAIVDERLLNAAGTPTTHDWERAREAARAWVHEHPPALELVQLQPPDPRNHLR